MAITILPPASAYKEPQEDGSSEDSDVDGGVELEAGSGARPSKRLRHSLDQELVTPGETVTDDPQWMR